MAAKKKVAKKKPAAKKPAAKRKPRAKVLKKKVILGGYGHKAGADRECQQFLHPNVFQYQTAIFPDPRDHGVEAIIKSAEPIELKEAANPLNPWAVELEVHVTGDNAANWLQKFEDRVRMQRVV